MSESVINAWMFPGQGAQKPGMGRQLVANYAVAREFLDKACQMSGLPLAELMTKGPQTQLNNPQVAEPLLTVVACSYAKILQDAGIRPDYVAGYSAGEVAAFYAAGILSLDDALRAALIRGRVLCDYCNTNTRMVAVQRIPGDQVFAMVEKNNEVYMAGENAPDHFTLVGDTCAISELTSALRQRGAEIADVETSGAWHTPHVDEAAGRIAIELAECEFKQPQCDVYCSVSGAIERSPQQLRKCLAEQVAKPVQWRRIMDAWKSNCAMRVTELGAGQLVLMLRRNRPDLENYHAKSIESSSGGIKALRRELTENQTIAN